MLETASPRTHKPKIVNEPLNIALEKAENVLFVLLLYIPSQQLWSLRDGQFT